MTQNQKLFMQVFEVALEFDEFLLHSQNEEKRRQSTFPLAVTPFLYP